MTSTWPALIARTLLFASLATVAHAGLLQHQPTTAQINLGLSLRLGEKRGSRQPC
jgi:hypothetical protein